MASSLFLPSISLLFPPNPTPPLKPRLPSLRLPSLSLPRRLRLRSFASSIPDEWGEKDPEPEVTPEAAPVVDPPRDEDEWGGDEAGGGGSGSEEVDEVGDLKRCLVDSFYATELGLKASGETRAEVLEIVNQLEAKNPTPAPTEEAELLDGNWILLYTAFSELLPLIAVASTPLLKIEKIKQMIDTKKLSVSNIVTLSNPFATFSFSASASFEVRSPSRIQVTFQEGIFEPPQISSTINLPNNIEIFGQKISLSPVEGALAPLQQAAANIAGTISGQPPLKIPIPGQRTSSFLLTTFLDKDLRISRGDGGLFVLAREGSPLLD